MNAPEPTPEAVERCLQRLREIRPTLATTLEPWRGRDLRDSLDRSIDGVPARIDPGVVEGRPLATFILGCGRGIVARAVLEGLRGTEARTLAIVVEPDPRRLLASLAVDDWREVLADDRVRFAVGEDVEEAIDQALPEHPNALVEIGLRPGVGLVDGDAPDRAPDIRRTLGKATERAMAALSTACRTQAKERDRGESTPRLPDGGWRILSVVHERTTALKHLGPAIVDAARRAGHEGVAHVLDRDGVPFSRSLATTVALRSNADLVVGFLEPGSAAIPWRRDYPSLVVVSSNPALLPIDRYPWTERDLVVVTEPAFAAPYRRLGLDPLVRPLATAVHPIEAIERQAASTPRCDALVVGTLPPGTEDRTDLDLEERRLIGELGETLAGRPDLEIDAVLAERDLASTAEGWTPFHLAVAYEATRRRRVAAVVALLEAGLEVFVHGDEGWRPVLREVGAEATYRGWLPEGLAQAAAFRRAGVVVNVNSFAAPGSLNMRSFAVPAAGGVLVSDDRPALHASFEVGREALAFRDVADLPEIVSTCLRNDGARRAMADAGRARIERDHSWDAWWAWAETALRTRFPDRPEWDEPEWDEPELDEPGSDGPGSDGPGSVRRS